MHGSGRRSGASERKKKPEACASGFFKLRPASLAGSRLRSDLEFQADGELGLPRIANSDAQEPVEVKELR